MTPPGFKITTVHAFICTEPDGTEGIPAFTDPRTGAVFPLVAADKARIDSLRPIALSIQRKTGFPMVLAKFSVRENIETLSAPCPTRN